MIRSFKLSINAYKQIVIDSIVKIELIKSGLF